MTISDSGARLYAVIDAKSITELTRLCERYMEEGWQCQGGVVVVDANIFGSTEPTAYYQAVIK